MGGGLSVTSSTTKNIIDTYMSAVNTSVQTTIQSSDITQGSSQTLQLNVCTVDVCGEDAIRYCKIGDVNVNQNSISNSYLNSGVLSKVRTQFSNNLKSFNENFISNTTSSQQQWLTIAFNFNFNDSTQVQNTVESITNQMVTSLKNECSTMQNAAQNAKTALCGYVGSFSLTQQNAVNSAVSCVTQNLNSVFVQNSEYAEGIQKANNATMDGGPSLFTVLEWIGLGLLILIIIFIIIRLITYASRGEHKDEVQKAYVAQYTPGMK